MKTRIGILLLGLAVLIGGCSPVSTRHIVGMPVQADLSSKFDGLWDFDDDNVGYVKYTGQGQLHISGTEWERDHFKPVDMAVILTECGNHQFVNFQDEEGAGDKEREYLFAYIKFVDDRYFLAWLPKKEIFAQAVTNGLLQGQVIPGKNSNSVLLTDTPENICLFIKKYKIEELFELEDPIVYRRIRKVAMPNDSSPATNASGTTTCAKPPCP